MVDNTSTEHNYNYTSVICFVAYVQIASINLIPSMCKDCAQERKRSVRRVRGRCAVRVVYAPCLSVVGSVASRERFVENDLLNENHTAACPGALISQRMSQRIL